MSDKDIIPQNPEGDQDASASGYEEDETLDDRLQDKKTKALGPSDSNNLANSQTKNLIDNFGTKQFADSKALMTPQDRLPHTLRFLIREGNGKIEKSTRVSLVLGRKNSTLPVDVDLTPFGAVQLGISRQHVKIEPRTTHLVIKDLNSINGTLLNRFQMKSGHFYDLSDGDELKLGRMHITIRFIYD